MTKYSCEKCSKTFSTKKTHAKHTESCDITSSISIPKPILKWVGGKTQILYTILTHFPTLMNNYREIFLGGGSVLLGLLSHVKSGKIAIEGKIYAYDINEPLVYVYKNIQSSHKELFATLQKIIVEFNECGDGDVNRAPANLTEAKISKENYYYWIRVQYNALSTVDKKTIAGSAMFIFLNKTCFRGVFRVGPRGFNVPYGHYNHPEIINQVHLEEIHQLIQGVIFECVDFSKSLETVEPGDYLYLDPPYAPEKATSFVGYTENGFTLDNHNQLFNLLHPLQEKRVTFTMSNADVSLVREKFANPSYHISSIECKRSINSKKPQSKTMEVFVKNY